MPVPADKFEAGFGIAWKQALANGVVYNALDACKVLGVDASGLDALWAGAKKVKLGGGFYCGLISVPGQTPIYVFNGACCVSRHYLQHTRSPSLPLRALNGAPPPLPHPVGFFMEMRSKFVQPGTSIHYYVVSFDPAKLPWADFRAKVLGPTDPKDAPEGALRGTILKDWKALGLKASPNVGDNGVHASASPFEALAEQMNWLKVEPTKDAFGAELIKAGVSVDKIKAWSVDPQVAGKSIFDTLEDLDSAACIAAAAKLA